MIKNLGGHIMEITNKNGQIVKAGVFANDILKDHLSTHSLFEKRNLPFKTRSEFLGQLKKVLVKNPKLFNTIKKTLERNDCEIEKMKTKKENQQNAPKQAKAEAIEAIHQTVDTLTKMEEKRESLISSIAKEEKNLKTAESILITRNEVVSNALRTLELAKFEQKLAQNDVKTATSKLQNLKQALSEIEIKIEKEKNKTIYLVAPGYSGEIPSFGTFISTEKIDNIKINLIFPITEFLLKPDFNEMINAGYDSAQEYINALRFVALISEFVCGEKNYILLVSDKKIQKLIHIYIGD